MKIFKAIDENGEIVAVVMANNESEARNLVFLPQLVRYSITSGYKFEEVPIDSSPHVIMPKMP